MLFSEPIKSISPRELNIGLEQGAIYLIDVREPHEFFAASVKGAVSMPLSSFDAKRIENREAKEIVIMCQGGMRSAQAIRLCQKVNIAAANLAGGIMAWQQNGYEVLVSA